MSMVLYLIQQPLDERNYERFGIQNWLDRGWQVEVWDLTPLSHPRVWRQQVESGSPVKELAQYFALRSRRHLEQRCSINRKIDYFIDFAGDDYTSIRVKRRLIRAGATRVVCSIGSIPGPVAAARTSLSDKWRKARAAGSARSLRLLASVLVNRLAAASIRPGVTIVSGEESMPSGGNGHASRIIKAHNLDYDVYLRSGAAAGTDGGYAVFIDQDYCFHPEYIYQNVAAHLTPESYFPALCRGLRSLAAALGIDVRIAAHPRASYGQRGRDYFEGIPLVQGATAELIRNCRVVVCHDSTAVQFAVLFGKPVIFLTTDALDRVFFDSSFKGQSIAGFAAELGKSVINLDRDLAQVDWQRELRIDVQKYARYRNRFIKTDGSPEIPYWDIVIAGIERAAGRTPVAAG